MLSAIPIPKVTGAGTRQTSSPPGNQSRRAALDRPRLIFAFYSPTMKAVSSICRVSFIDGADVTHTVTVSASSLYEAAALGIAEFKKSGFAFGGINLATKLRVSVEPPSITHELSVAKLQAWLDSNGKSPREQAKKVTLRQILGRA